MEEAEAAVVLVVLVAAAAAAAVQAEGGKLYKEKRFTLFRK